MTVIGVAFDGTRVINADSTTNWTAATATPTLETDFFYQGANCVSAQIKTSESGFYYRQAGVTHDFSTSPQRVWLAKTIQTNKDALDGNGHILEIGDGTRTNYHRYFVWSATTYPIPGGFQIIPINPNLSAYRSATVGTPNLAAVDFFGVQADCSAIAKAPNTGMDAIDYVYNGTGLTLSGGTGADTDGTFSDFVAFDEGTVTNRYGVVTTRDGILYVVGVLTIGTSSATSFTDSNRVLVFPSGRFSTGFCGLDFGLQSSGTSISLASCVLNGRGALSASIDTRPDYSVVGSSGSLSVTNTTFNVFRNIELQPSATLSSCNLLNGLLLVQSGGTVTGCTISGSTNALSSSFIVSDRPDRITDCSFFGNLGHAIELTRTGSFTFDGNSFAGFGANGAGNAAIHNASSGSVTLNITGGGSTPTVRNGTGSSTTINNNVAVTLTGLRDGTEVRVYAAGTTTELAGIETATDGTVDDRSFTFSLQAGTSIDIRIHSVTYETIALLAFAVPTQDASVPIQQRFDRNYQNG